MAVICGREEWTLPIELTLPPHFSHTFRPLSLSLPLADSSYWREEEGKKNLEWKQNDEKSVLAAEKKRILEILRLLY